MLTTRERLLEGGDNGAVVVPGKPDSSRLAKALVPNADPHMPPRKQLTEAQIKTIRAWIKSGLEALLGPASSADTSARADRAVTGG